MRYLHIILIITISIVLTGCFQKPVAPEDNQDTDTPAPITEQETPDQEEIEEEDNEESTEETNDEESTEDDMSSEEEDVVIEEIEQELEELFSDLLGENADK